MDRTGWPKWVRFTLWGIKSRRLAVAFAALSIIMALAAVVLATTTEDIRYWFGLGVALAGPVYMRAAAWVDANGEWG